MKITALTCTFERPQAFALCQQYVARQTRQPDQWLILDGPEPMREKVLKAIRSGAIEGDAVVFFEDDDFVAAGWLAWCEKHLARHDIVGQGHALYYHVRQRWMSNCRNTRHASLCQTAMRSHLLPQLALLIEAFDNNFFDTRLWRLNARRYLHIPKDGERLVVGIKGMPGKLGYSHEHANMIPKDVTIDPSLFHLWQHIGADALNYSSFYDQPRMAE